MYHDERSLTAMLEERFPREAPFSVSRLSGGVSSLVFMAQSARGRRMVIKQSLAELAVSEHWPAPRSRILNEIRGMRLARSILGEGHVPEVLWVEEEEYLFGMEAVPDEAVLLKTALMAGEWDATWFNTAGALLGALHASPIELDGNETANSQKLFHDLRIDPYFLHSARVMPRLSNLMDEAVHIAQADGRSLVHGDFSPKNIFVMPATGRLILLDFEVMHRGCPSFDVAFFLTHPLAKAVVAPNHAPKFGMSIAEFWRAYQDHCGPSGAREDEVLVLWAAIAAARVVGKSPLEYIRTEDAKSILLNWNETINRLEARNIATAAARIARGF